MRNSAADLSWIWVKPSTKCPEFRLAGEVQLHKSQIGMTKNVVTVCHIFPILNLRVLVSLICCSLQARTHLDIRIILATHFIWWPSTRAEQMKASLKPGTKIPLTYVTPAWDHGPSPAVGSHSTSWTNADNPLLSFLLFLFFFFHSDTCYIDKEKELRSVYF